MDNLALLYLVTCKWKVCLDADKDTKHLAEIRSLYCSDSCTEELGSIVAKDKLLPNTEL